MASPSASAAGSEIAWDPGTQSCVWVPLEPSAVTRLSDFQWRERESAASTHSGRAIQAFRDAMGRLARTSEGRAFNRLNQHPDYSARFDAGYEQGRQDGSQAAAQQWYDDYTDMLELMAGGLGTVLSDPRLAIQFIAAGIDELVFRTIDPSSPPLWQNPRYREVLVALRGPGGAAPAPDDGAPPDLDEDVAEMLEVAAHADAMRRVPERLWSSKVMERVDLQVADWVAEFTSGTSSLMVDVLALNCRPYDQGYLVGSWTSQAIVNTLRRAVEATLRFIGSDPTLIPMAIMLPPATLTERALDALIRAVSVELLDED